MADAQLGMKRSCPNCGARFYDLGKMPVECPKCDASFIPEILLPPKEPRPSASKAFTNKRWAPNGAPKNETPDVIAGTGQGDGGDEEMAAARDVDADESDANDVSKDDANSIPEVENEDTSDVSGLVEGVTSHETPPG